MVIIWVVKNEKIILITSTIKKMIGLLFFDERTELATINR